jgi:phosphate uptake regulator
MQTGKMEKRKVQKTGGSSYIITLPKEWLMSIIDNESEIKGTELGLIVQSDHSLLVTPYLTGRKFQRNQRIDLEKINDPKYLFRYLISTYITGYTEIELVSEKAIDPSTRTAIRKFIQTVRYQEIIEETENYIHIKDLLDPEEMPFPNLIQRMSMTAKNMHKDAVYALKNQDRNLLENIITRDNDVDRLHWLMTRITNMLLRDASLSEKIHIQPETAANMFLLSRIIERIADHGVRFAENALNLVDYSLDKEVTDQIDTAVTLGLDVFQNSIDALFDNDISKANENIDMVEQLYKLSQGIMDYTFKQESVLAIPLDNIVESIRRLGEYSRDISENVMNNILLERA